MAKTTLRTRIVKTRKGIGSVGISLLRAMVLLVLLVSHSLAFSQPNFKVWQLAIKSSCFRALKMMTPNGDLRAYLNGEISYLQIQKKLWAGVELESAEVKVVSRINRSIFNFPVYKGRLFRNDDLDDEVLSGYVVGKTVVRRGFVSTSKNWIQAFGGNTLIIISSVSGRDVEKFSPWGSEEKEVIFRSGTRFRVLHKVSLKLGETLEHFDPMIFKDENEFDEWGWLLEGGDSNSGTFSNVLVLEEI